MIPKNTDIKSLRTGLSQFEIHEAINENRKLQEARLIEQQKAYLGPRYLCDLSNAPAKGFYNNQGTRLQ